MKYKREQLKKYGIRDYVKFATDGPLFVCECDGVVIYESAFGKVVDIECDNAVTRFINKIRKEKLNKLNEKL